MFIRNKGVLGPFQVLLGHRTLENKQYEISAQYRGEAPFVDGHVSWWWRLRKAVVHEETEAENFEPGLGKWSFLAFTEEMHVVTEPKNSVIIGIIVEKGTEELIYIFKVPNLTKAEVQVIYQFKSKC